MNFFTAVFFALCVVCAIVTWLQRKNGDQAASENVSQEFRKCQRAYLIAYFCAVTADWLQGPYVYALYEHYKFTSCLRPRYWCRNGFCFFLCRDRKADFFLCPSKN